MKHLTSSLTAAACLFVFACADCDDDSPANANADIVSTFRITAFTAPESVDINGDGQPSQNLVHESDCYAPSFLTINSDGTYRLRHNALEVTQQALECASQTTTGNWTRNGNDIVATPHYADEPLQFVFSPGNKTVSLTNAAPYPRTGESGQMEMAEGEVTIVFAEQ